METERPTRRFLFTEGEEQNNTTWTHPDPSYGPHLWQELEGGPHHDTNRNSKRCPTCGARSTTKKVSWLTTKIDLEGSRRATEVTKTFPSDRTWQRPSGLYVISLNFTHCGLMPFA